MGIYSTEISGLGSGEAFRRVEDWKATVEMAEGICRKSERVDLNVSLVGLSLTFRSQNKREP